MTQDTKMLRLFFLLLVTTFAFASERKFTEGCKMVRGGGLGAWELEGNTCSNLIGDSTNRTSSLHPYVCFSFSSLFKADGAEAFCEDGLSHLSLPDGGSVTLKLGFLTRQFILK